MSLRLPDVVGGIEDISAGATYDAATHSLIINTESYSPAITVTCRCTSLDFGKNGIDCAESHIIDLNGEVGIDGGSMSILLTEDPMLLSPDKIDMSISYRLDDLTITSAAARVKHDIGAVDAQLIDITGLPDLLSQPGTDLLLANPCLYLSIDNPLAECDLTARAGFGIDACRDTDYTSYRIDGQYFDIAAKPTVNLCLSPKDPANPDPEFKNCEYVPFSSLGRILSGDGVPDALQVVISNPCIPEQYTSSLLLGHDYGAIRGRYKFVAPLQLGSGSKIVYSDRLDGWGEDVQKVTVKRLSVALEVTTDIPVSIKLTAYPLDKNGNRIGNVSITGAEIPANAKAQKVTIEISGEASGIDGIEFTAVASADDEKALSPSMNINLNKIRPCISGYYNTEL